MAVVELGWTPEKFWHSSWHEFHGAVEYLAEKRQREAAAIRGARAGAPAGAGAARGEQPSVKVKGRPAVVLPGESRVTVNRPEPAHDRPLGEAWVNPDFIQFRDNILAKFGTQLRFPD